MLCRGGKALALSEDHKPSQASERARIMAAGGFLSEIGGITRVNGNLNLSRAIGDLRYKMNAQVPGRVVRVCLRARKEGVPAPAVRGAGGRAAAANVRLQARRRCWVWRAGMS